MKILKGTQKRPRRVLLYGKHGIGKSTWGASTPNPIVLATEDGLADIGVDRTPTITELAQVNESISWLLTSEHEYRTVVVDTIDWLERLIFAQVARDNGKSSISDIAYGRGYDQAVRHWEFILRGLDALRQQKNMAIVLLGHSRIVRVDDPECDSYERHEPDLHKSGSPLLQEWCDEVLFARYRVDTVSKDAGFGKDRVRAVGTGDRIVWTCERPTHVAKRRVPLPDVISLDFSEYAKHLSAAYTPAAESIDGVVTNGSSKKKETANG